MEGNCSSCIGADISSSEDLLQTRLVRALLTQMRPLLSKYIQNLDFLRMKLQSTILAEDDRSERRKEGTKASLCRIMESYLCNKLRLNSSLCCRGGYERNSSLRCSKQNEIDNSLRLRSICVLLVRVLEGKIKSLIAFS